MTLKIPVFAHRMGEVEGAPTGAPSDSREVQISFSSEVPYTRPAGQDGKKFLEILGHDPAEVDLTRLNSGAAPLLKDHIPRLDAKVGTVVRAWIEAGKGHALVRFSDTPAGSELLERVRSGDVTCVSVGYAVSGAKRAPDQDGQPVVRVTRWVPKEISFVAIPADPTVGFGRSDMADAATITVTEKDGHMPKDIINDAPKSAAKPKSPEAPETRENAALITDALTAERQRTESIDEIATRFDLPSDMATKAKRDGTSVEVFNNLTLDHLGSAGAEATRAGSTMIGLTDKEKDSFSVVKLLRSLATPDDRRLRNDAGFEFEAVTAATESHKGQVRGVILPSDITNHSFAAMNTRASDQLAGTPNLGGNLVDDVLMSGSMIDILRKVSILSQMGVRVFGGLTGDVSFPKHLTDVNAFWVAEDGSPTKSGMTFGQVKMTPRTCAAMTELSRRLLLQTSADIEAYARQSIIASIALKVDAAGINGDAAPGSPNGLADASGVNEVDFATAGEPTYAEVVGMRTKVKKQNALLGSLGYVLSPDIEEHLLTTPKFTGGDTPIMVDEGRLGGYRAVGTNQTPVDEMWFGNWSDLYMGLWSGLDIMVDPYTNSASGAVRVVAHQDVDFAVARAQSFTRGKLIP
ncbi:phage major capsid protein [Falsiruegeria litorea]|uniref:phage major capsid protein n=1 Tax=Falsiruegeria litorea TaxID=1280831 RepID=UPI001BFCE05F|nr:phage major capsid protein [Falsiruegeria litorea]MBT8169879.1 phage major capsid protein [Falsiruegeria litorea]